MRFGPRRADRGAFLARRGHALDEGLVHALTRLLHSEEVDDCVDDILVSRGPRLYLLQRTPRSGCYLFVELERAVCNLGLARSRLQAIARRLAPDDEWRWNQRRALVRLQAREPCSTHPPRKSSRQVASDYASSSTEAKRRVHNGMVARSGMQRQGRSKPLCCILKRGGRGTRS